MDPDVVWRCMHLLMHAAPRRQIVVELLSLPSQILRMIGTGEMYDLIRCIDWMQIDPRYTKPVAPWIDHRSKFNRVTRLYLPGDDFKNVTGGEYAMLSDLYEEFKEDADSDVESRMIALTLRPAGDTDDPASDPRVRLKSSDQARAWLPIIRALPDSVRAYMTTLISANIAEVYDRYKDWLFTSSSSEDESSGLNFGWWGLFMDVAQDGVFGNFDQVLATPMHTICMHQVRKVDEARRMKEEHDHAMVRAGMK